MASWRTVHGHIHRLDQTLVTDADIEAFFAEERILGRGKPDGEGGYTFEVAVGGRRRRIATLDEAGMVFRGRSVNDLVEQLSERLRKVEVDLDGTVAHGPIDLGSVDISDEALAEDVDDEGPTSDAEIHDAAFDREGAMLVIIDLPLSEVPGIVKAEDEPMAVSKLGEALVMVAKSSLDSVRQIFPRPSFQIMVSAGKVEENPTLYVRRDNSYLTWDWSGELPVFPWIDPDSEAYEFVVDETGAGAVARKMVADVIAARFGDIRAALCSEEGPRALVDAFGLPSEVADVLEGTGELAQIPNSRLFEPSSAGAAFEDRLAFELAGEGFVEPNVAGVYRKVYLERPWAVAFTSAAQAAVGGAMLASAFGRSGRGMSWRMRALVGGGVVVSGLTRILTTAYAAELVRQKQNEIDTWKRMHNWQENRG